MTARAPVHFEVPSNAVARECRSCKARIYWVNTAAGRRMPVDPDGTSHFATCPDADMHRRGGPAA